MKCNLLALTLLAGLTASTVSAQVDSDWLEPTSGDWLDVTRWSTNPIAPTNPGDTATLAATGSPHTATITTNVSLDRIAIDSPDASVLLQGGTLTAATRVQANQGPLLIESGTIANTRLEGAAGVRMTNLGSNPLFLGTKFDTVTLATEVKSDPNKLYGSLELANALILDQGEISLSENLWLATQGALTISGNGAITVGGGGSADWDLLNTNADVLLGPGIALRAIDSSRLYVDDPPFPGGEVDFENRGTIEAMNSEIAFASNVVFKSPQGVIRATDNAYVDIRDATGNLGPIELEADSRIRLQGDFVLTQPVTVPAGSRLEFPSTGWQSATTVTVDGGTVQVRRGPATGTWVWGNDSAIEVRSTMLYTDLLSYGIAPDTTVRTIRSFGGYISLNDDAIDLNTISTSWDFSSGGLLGGTITGFPNGGKLINDTDSLVLNSLTLDTPLEVERGNLTFSGSTLSQPLLVSGGSVRLSSWSSSSTITVDGGVVDFNTLPVALGTIALHSGEIVLPAIPNDPSPFLVSGGTVSIDGVDFVLGDLVNLPWTPDAYAPGVGGSFNLEGQTVDVTAGPVGISLGGGTIYDGTITNSNGTEPWHVRGGTLRNVTLLTDVQSTSTVYLSENITVDKVRLAGDYSFSTGTTSNVVLDEAIFDGRIAVGTFNGVPPAVIVRNGLTVNGLIELGTRMLQLEGTQTIDGSGEMDTDGIRGSPGGGIEVVNNGSLTFGPDFTFHSRRNGSRIIVSGPNFTNEGTIVADVNEYNNGDDVPAPGLTIAIGGGLNGRQLLQNGLVQVVDGYEIRVEAFEIHNAGEIELRGGDLTGSGVELINTGVVRGRGTFASTGDGQFVNQGEVAVGNLEAFDEAAAEPIGRLQVAADFHQTELGKLSFDLAGQVAGTDFDQLSIFGSATLAGELEVSLLEGFTPIAGEAYPLITATDGITGEFDLVSIIGSGLSLDWSLIYTANVVSIAFDFLPGDFNADGAITGGDFLAWQRGESSDPFSTAELANWQSTYGSPAASDTATQTVPEPSSLVLVALGIASWKRGRSKRLSAATARTSNVR